MNPQDPPDSPPQAKRPHLIPSPVRLQQRAERRRAKLLAFEGRSAREISEILGISLSMGQHYREKWKKAIGARDEEERNMARGMALANYQLALDLVQEARGAKQPILVKGEPLLGPDGLPLYYETPQWEALPKLLERLESITGQLGEFCHSIGSTGVAAIRAKSDQDLQAAEQSFKQERPDLIPGLGFAHSPANGGPGGPGGMTLQFLVNPKLPEALAIDRQRLEAKRIEQGERQSVPAGVEALEAEEVDDLDGDGVD